MIGRKNNLIPKYLKIYQLLMKSFQEFLEEGRKKKIEKLAKQIEKTVSKDVKTQRKENPNATPVADYGNSKPHSKEAEAAMMAMMRRDKAARKRMKKNLPED